METKVSSSSDRWARDFLNGPSRRDRGRRGGRAYTSPEARATEIAEAAAERAGWTQPMGGSDSAGNPITVAFGEGRRDGETFLADGDASEGNFFEHDNHDHYGSGDGPNDNGTRRGQYSGPGH
jgi:hypothetical protein